MQHNLDNIKNVIIDLGKVIIDLEEARTIEAFRKLGVSNISDIYHNQFHDPVFDDFEKGLMSIEQFRNSLKAKMDIPLTDEQIDEAWAAMLVGIPDERMRILEKLNDKYRMFLLSNTNEFHMRMIFDMQNRGYGTELLIPYFEREYYSYLLGMRKPDIKIYNLILEENDLVGEETLFVDDTLEHVDSAGELGIQGIHLEGGLENLGVKFGN